jgi:hypothetical protein
MRMSGSFKAWPIEATVDKLIAGPYMCCCRAATNHPELLPPLTSHLRWPQNDAKSCHCVERPSALKLLLQTCFKAKDCTTVQMFQLERFLLEMPALMLLDT